MLRIQTILHPTDFSDRSSHALHLAQALARDYQAELVVLHVVPQPIVGYGEGVIPPDPEVLVQEGREELDRLLQTPAAIVARRRVEHGDPAMTILRVAGEHHAGLIVMGTHGRTGLARLLMGSVAEQVVRRAPCPVLTVKTPFPAAATDPASAELSGVAGPL